jgi:aldose 1-epimerase
LSADPFDLAGVSGSGLLALTDGTQRALIDSACGGTVHRLELVPAGDDGEGAEGVRGRPIGAESVLLGDDPVDPGPAVRRDRPGAFRGRILVPYNDRIIDGTYRWDGDHFELPRNDAETGDAIHGFLYRAPCASHAEGTGMRLSAVLPARPGYPFPLSVEIIPRLAPSVFGMTVSIRNEGSGPAPVAAGWHPYFQLPVAGGPSRGSVDPLILHVPADTYVEVDDRLSPTGRYLPVAATSLDFSRPRRIGSEELDDAFLHASPSEVGDGTSGGVGGTVTLASTDRVLEVSGDGLFRMFQIYIPPDRRSIAIEPVSSPANVFNRPEMGLTVLPAGQAVTGTIRVRYRYF